MVHDEAERCDEERKKKLEALASEVEQLQGQIDNLVEALANGIQSSSVQEKLRQYEASLRNREYSLGELQHTRPEVVDIPPMEEQKQLARASLQDLAGCTDWEHQQAVRRMIPRIIVFPVQCIDGGKVCLRARFSVYPGNALEDKYISEVLADVLRKDLTIDLFDYPQRVYHREAVLEYRKGGKTERQAAEICEITSTAAQHAAALQRLMDKKKVSDPYQYIKTQPQEGRKLRRAQHPRYKFDPLPGAGE